MKQFILIIVMAFGLNTYAQNNQELLKHYQAYYKQMKAQADVQGIINGLTHLNILSPSTARQDTLAYMYMNEGKFVQALNTIGVDVNSSDSNLAVEIKAVSLKGLSQPKLAIPQFEELFKRTENVTLAYELAELYLQTRNMAEGSKYVEYGLLHVQDNMNKIYYEMEQPYQVPLKAGFLYLKALIVFNENKESNIDIAVSYLEEALTIAPTFNLAYISRDALLGQKLQLEKKD